MFSCFTLGIWCRLGQRRRLQSLPEPQNVFALSETMNKQDGFEMTEADQQVAAAHALQMTGHFLLDRNGIVRWRYIEASERMEDFSKFPSDEEILAAAREL